MILQQIVIQNDDDDAIAAQYSFNNTDWYTTDTINSGQSTTIGFANKDIGSYTVYMKWTDADTGTTYNATPQTRNITAGHLTTWSFTITEHQASSGGGDPEPTGTWVDRTDNTYWYDTGGGGYWDGDSWYAGWEHVLIALQTGDNANWYVGFRPTKIRLTFTGAGSGFSVRNYGGTIYIAGTASSTTITSGQEIDLDFSEGEDLGRIYMSGGEIDVTKIEFYVES